MHYPMWQWRGLGVLAVSLALALPVSAQKLRDVAKTDQEQKQPDLTKRYFPTLRTMPNEPATPVPDPQGRRASGAPSAMDRLGIYVVAKGDTMAGVATRFRVNVRDLARENGLNTHATIHDGQVLCIPQPTQKAAAPEYSSDKNRIVADTALQYRGVPYRWAGMSSRGLDCSGLVSLVLRSNGVEAPHNAARLYQLGTPVAAEDLQAGDLVFFHTRGQGVSHVGIYIGEDKFVHASSRSHQVTVNRLSEKYYQQHYVGAKRIDI